MSTGTAIGVGIHPAYVPEASSSSFRDLVATIGGSPARILDIGAGGFAGDTTTVHLVDLFPEATIVAVELQPDKADALRDRFGDRVEVVTGDIGRYLPEEPFDLTVIDFDSALIPIMFDSLLERVLVPLTRSGGVIVTDIMLDLFNAYHGPQPLMPGAEPEMAAFMLRRFGHLLLTDARVKAAYAEHPELTPVVTIEKWRGEAGNMMGWSAFRCHRADARWEELAAEPQPDDGRIEVAQTNDVDRDKLQQLFHDGEYLALDLVGDPASCGADCPAMVEFWSNYFRTRFGPALALAELLPRVSEQAVTAPDGADVIVPPWPLAMLEIPDSIDAYSAVIGAKSRNMVRKAARHGYVYGTFAYNEHLDEIHAINISKPVRAGGPLRSHMHDRPKPVVPQALCDFHQVTYLGAFRDGELRAYIQLVQVGEVGVFNRILGHGEALPHGVMNGLVEFSVKWCIGSHTKALNYLTIVDAAEGLVRFKLNVGFRSRAVAVRVRHKVPAPA